MDLLGPARASVAVAILVVVGCATASQPVSSGFPPSPPASTVADAAPAAPASPTLVAQAPVTAPGSTTAPGEPEPPASEVTPDPWPKTAEVNGTRFTIYQPQLDSWDDYNYQSHAAVQVLPAGSKDPVFGVVEITAYTIVDRTARVVHIEGATIAKATFPSAPQSAAAWQNAMQGIVASGPSSMSLARLEAALAIEGATRKALQVPVENTPPQIVVTQGAAALVLLQGEPVWRTVDGTNLTRAINTRALLLKDAYGMLYVHVLEGFMTAPSLSGPWTVAASPPKGANQAAQQLGKKGLVDLMEGPVAEGTGKRPTLAQGAPQIVVATQPTEVITTTGPFDWLPIEGTQLIYLANTTGNVFRDLVDQSVFVLVTGRWFRAPALTGPWTYVPGKDLPVDFALIPDTSPKENVKASVPTTPQAQEAAIEAGIPHMATVYTAKVAFQPVVNGAPVLKPVPDTGLMYVFNSPQPILMVTPTQWYAVQAGVWFQAASLKGPWAVATSIPAVIYSIPPSSPLFYVTFVKIYAVSPGVVVVGYTPGYTGVVVTPDGTVVYGTGYTYPAYMSGAVWYPPPITYGYAANVTYTPWTGFAMGFAIGWSAAHWCYAPVPYWGAMPYYYHPPMAYGGAYYGAYHGAYGGAAAWGPGGWAATSGNMYSHYGATSAVTRNSAGYNAWTGNAWSSKVGTSYNSVTGRASAGQRASVSNVYTGGYASGSRGATYNPTTGVGASGGRATVGNAYTGQQTTVGRAQVTGPGGQTTKVAQSGDNYYADHDGNVYSHNTSTGQTQKFSSNGGWSNVDKGSGGASSWDSVAQSRSAGDARSASSSWGGGGGWGGGDRSAGGWGGGGGGGHSWGGGGWGGGGGGGWGGFHGGGGFRR